MPSARIPLLVITGLTASGKTSLSLQLARHIDCEIISADSMQIYQDMDIGTDKISPKNREKTPHHLIDIVSPEDDFSVADYKNLAERKIADIIAGGRLPVMVGGTGLYIKAVTEGFMLPRLPENKLRNEFISWAEQQNRKSLHNYLKSIDPECAANIHPNDLRRVSRALEIYFMTGRTRSYYRYRQQQKKSKYNHLKIALRKPRKKLYQDINYRVDSMIAEGLVAEVEKLRSKYDLSKTARQAVGYKEIIAYLEGETSLQEAVRLIKRNSRHLAKKQQSFIKRDREYIWLDSESWPNSELLIYLLRLVEQKFFQKNFTTLKESF